MSIGMAQVDYKDPDWLEEQYHLKGKTMKEMASEFGIAHRTIAYHMDKHDIKTRSSGPKLADERLKSEKWCREQYVEKEKSFGEIAENSSSAYPTVRKYMLKHGIKPREAGGSNLIYDELGDEKALRNKYVDQGKSMSQIADEVGCGLTAVHRALVRHDMATRGQGQPSGEEHPNWEGGSDYQYYGPSWPKQRVKALERAGYECEHTGITQKQHKKKYGMGLHVHHITPFSEYGLENHRQANRLSNLRVLSCSQHTIWEGIPTLPGVEYE